VHRVAQFVGHLRASVAPEEEAVARRLLPVTAWPLYESMPIADRRHAHDVVDRLLAAGVDDTDALVAALLHDAAKGDRVRLWHRVAGVLLEAFAPALLRRLARDDERSWRYAFHLYLHHDALSALLARQAGSSERAAALIDGSVTDADARILRALRAADDAS